MLSYYIQIQPRFRADLLDNIIVLIKHQIPYLKLESIKSSIRNQKRRK